MDSFLIVCRLIVLAIVGWWALQLLTTLRKPAEWTSRGRRVARDRYRVVSLLGMVAGVAVLASSFLLPSLLR